MAAEDFPQRLDPRRMLWAGTLADIGNFVANPFTAQFQGLGPKYMMQAMQYNRQNEQLALNEQRGRLGDKTTMQQQQINARNLRQVENPYGQFPAQEQQYRQWLQSSGKPVSEQARTEFAEYARKLTLLGGSSNRPVRTFIGEDGNMKYISATGEVVDTGEKGSPPGEKIIEVGGAPYVQQTLPGGGIETVPLDQYQQDYRRGSVRTDTMTGEQNKLDAAFVGALQNEVPMLQQQLRNIDELAAAIENGQFSATGPGEGLYKKYTNPETAQLEAENIYQTLLNLQITNLAPVSNTELALVRSLFADIDRDPEVNLSRLKVARRTAQQKLDILKSKYEYAKGNNMSLQGYVDTVSWPESGGGGGFKVTGDPQPE